MHNDKSIDFTDPVCDEFYKNVWIQHAAFNTNTFDKVSLWRHHCMTSSGDDLKSNDDSQARIILQAR